jgi:magnesium chelatase family protein
LTDFLKRPIINNKNTCSLSLKEGVLMSTKVTSIGLKGLEGYKVTVEVQAVHGLNSIVIVGLPDTSVKESKQRITAAFHSLNVFLHQQKIIINLSPPEQKKNGPMFDLPIAIGILSCLQEITMNIPESIGFIGALSLDGSIQPVDGMLAAVLAAKQIGLKRIFLPYTKNLLGLEIENLELIFVNHLQQVVDNLAGIRSIPPKVTQAVEEEPIYFYPDFQNIIGHSFAKYALTVAAAGEHHVFMFGPPGCGKSLLAESFPSILPPLTKEARLEVMSIYQLSGITNPYPMIPPYRNPHHSSSGVSIIGGGQNPKPGEISLAHRGILFLDELAEFPKKTIEMLRQPLEAGAVSISRARTTVTYPSSFILIGAMNPCPCGYHGSPNHYCTCSTKQINAYQNRISGPMRDRFDIFLTLKPVNFNNAMENQNESSEEIRQRVADARKRQSQRYGKEITNGRVAYETLSLTSPLSQSQKQFLQKLAYKYGWSNRAQLKIYRLARTIADLEQKQEISEQHLWEALKLHSLSASKNAQIASAVTLPLGT